MSKKIAVIGANGQLGIDICRSFENRGDQVLALNHVDVEITEIDSIRNALNDSGTDIVINTAAMHHVGQCEDDPQKAFTVNGIGSRNLAQFCLELDIPLVHISTDYVFNGKKKSPYIENDRAVPLNVYGNTKLSGECFIESIAKKFFILRVSGIYGVNPCRAKGSNFVQTMLRLAGEKDELRVVDDEILTPTFTEDIAKQIVEMLEGEPEYGIYHVTAEGECSWYEFAKEIFAITGTDVVVTPADPGEFAGNVNRPKYCVLENKHLKDQNLNRMSHWTEGLRRYLTKKK